MDPKRLVIGSVVGTVVLNVYGVVVWDLLLGDFFATHAGSASGVEREAPVWWAVVLGALLMAALVTMVLEWSGSWSMGDAFKTGAILGLLLWGGVDFVYFGFFNLTDQVGTRMSPI